MANEKRLIDANEAIKIIRGQCVAKYPSTFILGLLAASDEIAKLPDVDAVEVVRCKDCIYWENGKDYEPYCNHFGNMMADSLADDFCSYGERMDDDGKA